MKTLTIKDVTFTLLVESEETPVRGNALVSGDDEADRECEDEIIERLERGDDAAWCCLLVTATWEGYTGYASLGCCSFANDHWTAQQRELEQHATDYDLYTDALADLNATLARTAATLAELS